jgi:hypothetical protein
LIFLQKSYFKNVGGIDTPSPPVFSRNTNNFNVHPSTPFFVFEIFFNAFIDVKYLSQGKDKASEDTFFLIHLIFQSNLDPKIGD